ncbi:MAG: hypothetical protein Q7S15_01190 [bacterium]|nr:hypothetical protein [bacterium]
MSHDESLLASVRCHLMAGKEKSHIVESLALAGWQREPIERGIDYVLEAESFVIKKVGFHGRHRKLTTLIAAFLIVHALFLMIGFGYAARALALPLDHYVAFFSLIALLGFLARSVYRRHKLALVATLVYSSVIFVDITRTMVGLFAAPSGIVEYLNSAEGLAWLALFITAVTLFEVCYQALALKE